MSASFDPHPFFKNLQSREIQSKQFPKRIINSYYKSNTALQRLVTTKDLRHDGCVNTINFNPTGSLLVSGSDDTFVKVWDWERGKCKATLIGHSSNVFVTKFLPHTADREIVSGGNDSDIRLFNIENETCTIYRHHSKKVLGISINPRQSKTFLSCSADGTVRFYDIRLQYEKSIAQPINTQPDEAEDDIISQAYGGGRAPSFWRNHGRIRIACPDTVLLNYNSLVSRKQYGRRNHTLFNVDFHPIDGVSFIASGSDGLVRLFDTRMIKKNSPELSSPIVYSNKQLTDPSKYEATGCAFNFSGTELVVTNLGDKIYLYDVASGDQIEVEQEEKKSSGRSKMSEETNNSGNKIKRPTEDKKGGKKKINPKAKERKQKLFQLASRRPKHSAQNKTEDEKIDAADKQHKSHENEQLESDDQNESSEPKSKNSKKKRDALDELPIENKNNNNNNNNNDDSGNNSKSNSDHESSVKNSDSENNSNSNNEDNDDESARMPIGDFLSLMHRSGNENLDGLFEYMLRNRSEQINHEDNEESSEGELDWIANVSDSDIENNFEYEYDLSNTDNESDDEGNSSADGNGDHSDNDSDIGDDSPLKRNRSYEKAYYGHRSTCTIKGVNFYGPRSEYVVSGSDDSRVFIWETKTGRLVRILEGHRSVVNCVIGNPNAPVLATSGIDNEIKIWQPLGDPSKEDLEKRKRRMVLISKQNQSRIKTQRDADVCGTQ